MLYKCNYCNDNKPIPVAQVLILEVPLVCLFVAKQGFALDPVDDEVPDGHRHVEFDVWRLVEASQSKLLFAAEHEARRTRFTTQTHLVLLANRTANRRDKRTRCSGARNMESDLVKVES